MVSQQRRWAFKGTAWQGCYTWLSFIAQGALTTSVLSLLARFLGQHGALLGPIGPRWAPCWLHELCYLGYYNIQMFSGIIGLIFGTRSSFSKFLRGLHFGLSKFLILTWWHLSYLWLFTIYTACTSLVYIMKAGDQFEVARQDFTYSKFRFRQIFGIDIVCMF